MGKKNKNPVMNIGLVGHVDHGKTTLTGALSGVWTDKHSEELKRGITIKLGYANSDIYYCKSCDRYLPNEKCPDCDSKPKYIHTLSFVDAPGHESLMATMLSGAAIMDYAILIIAANEECPQPQTSEHLMALDIIGLDKIIVVQNKIDLVSKEKAIENFNQIKDFLKGTSFEDSPIIPVSAQQGANIDVLLKKMMDDFEIPKRDPEKENRFYVARSFDVNKPGTPIKNLVGGVIGGVVKQGTINVGDEVTIRPGRKVIEKNQERWEDIKTTIKGIHSGTEKLKEATPGGSMALSTDLDPAFVQGDHLLGSIVGKKDELPETKHKLHLDVNLLDRVVGSKSDIKINKLKVNEQLLLNVNSSTTVGIVTKVLKGGDFEISLKIPVCVDKGSRVTISRRVKNRFRLIGYGTLTN
ncbi:MAG: translation initiation factor IF-2 subunit gamma [Candidatus Woesearchaeota archaeon]